MRSGEERHGEAAGKRSMAQSLNPSQNEALPVKTLSRLPSGESYLEFTQILVSTEQIVELEKNFKRT